MRNIYYRTIRKAAIFTVFLILFISGRANAHEYQAMIRYDRVWENISYNYGGDLVKCLKFDGTEDIGGKTYHKLVAFKNSVRKRDGNQYVFTTPEDVYQPEGYMREEDGIVYTLVRENDKYETGGLFTCPEDLKEGDVLTEKAIYNFNVTDDEIFDMYSFIMRGGMPCPFKAFATELVDIAGEECRKIDFGPGYPADGSMEFINQYSMIEGIGATDYGCLNYTEFIDHPTKIWYYNYITRVFDMDGNVIYTLPDNICECLDYGSFNSVDIIAEEPSLTISADCISFGNAGDDNAVSIFDVNGTLVKSASKLGRLSIDTDGLQPGIYVVSAYTDGENIVNRKFIKNNPSDMV